MALDPSNSSNLEQLALKGLIITVDLYSAYSGRNLNRAGCASKRRRGKISDGVRTLIERERLVSVRLIEREFQIDGPAYAHTPYVTSLTWGKSRWPRLFEICRRI